MRPGGPADPSAACQGVSWEEPWRQHSVILCQRPKARVWEKVGHAGTDGQVAPPHPGPAVTTRQLGFGLRCSPGNQRTCCPAVQLGARWVCAPGREGPTPPGAHSDRHGSGQATPTPAVLFLMALRQRRAIQDTWPAPQPPGAVIWQRSRNLSPAVTEAESGKHGSDSALGCSPVPAHRVASVQCRGHRRPGPSQAKHLRGGLGSWKPSTPVQGQQQPRERRRCPSPGA